MSGAGPQLESLAAGLRSLVAQGRYPEAHRAWEDYCRALAALAPGHPAIRELERGFRELFAETRRRVLAGRAQAAVRLSRLPRPARPYGGGDAAPSTWRYFG